MESKSQGQKKETILCMYSGGIDSTGVLHQLLTDAKYKDYQLIVHHIHIQNRENRAIAELEAVNRILSYYKKNTNRQFLVTESTFNTMGFAPLRSNRFPFDMDVCAFLAGNICVARKDVRYVAMGRTKTDVDAGGENFMERMKRAQAIFNGVTSLDRDNSREYIFPVVDFSKEEVWNFLPDQVRTNTWWCRRPVYEEEKKPQPCGKCPTCKDVKGFSNASIRGNF